MYSGAFTRDLFITKLDNVMFAFLKQQCYLRRDPLTSTSQQTACYSFMTTKAQKLRESVEKFYSNLSM